jgi:hypothetical protein
MYFGLYCAGDEEQPMEEEDQLSNNELIRSATAFAQFSQVTFGERYFDFVDKHQRKRYSVLILQSINPFTAMETKCIFVFLCARANLDFSGCVDKHVHNSDI